MIDALKQCMSMMIVVFISFCAFFVIFVNISDVSDTYFCCMQVYVFPPTRVEFIESRVEAEVGTTLPLPIAVYGLLGQ